MAIAVVAFAVVSLVALLPAGLEQFRSAMNATVGSQIAQQVVSDAEQADFDHLMASAESKGSEFYVLPIRYFDEQGNEIVPVTPGRPTSSESGRIIYQVRVRGSLPGPADVTAGAGSGSFASLPAPAGGSRFRPRDSTFLTVQVALHPGSGELPVDDRSLWVAREGTVMTYSAVVTRNGYARKYP